MAAPVLAGIPMVYQMLVGAGILAGGAATANKMQNEIQNTIDTNPGIIDEALKNIFMGPARDLINPRMLEEIQNLKPTTTAKEKTMPATEISPDDVMANTLFQEPTNNLFGMMDTPSGIVLAPDATDIEKQRKEAAPKPLITPMPTGQQDQTLSTPIPEQIKTGTETFPVQEPQQQTLGTPVPEIMDTSVLTKEDTSYRIQHQPRGPETEDSVRLDDLTKSITGERAGYPDDFYSDKGQRLYAPGPRFKDDEFGMANQESFQIINKVRNKPDEEVTIYRAVPNDDKIKDINEGDFVTLSKKYAELHGAGGYGRDGKDAGKILEKKVKVKDIYWDQNDVNEFGYFPTTAKPETSTTDKFITKDKVSVTNNLKTQNFLEDKVMNKLLTMRGGSVEGFKELFKRAAPMPASTKAKMEIELQQMLFDKYKINSYPEGESEETINEFRKKYLIDTYNKRMGAIEYISSVAYDVIGEKSNNSLLVVDDDGIPLAGAKIAIPGTKDYNRSDIFSKDALVITEAGSVFKNAGDQLMKDIIQRAKDEGRRFVVAEDLTSEGALDAFMNRGFRTPTTKETKKFKGIKIRRPDGRSAVQKNLVLDLKEIEKNKE
jgi:hypothetical protein